MTKFLTIRQECERLQLAERTVYDLCRKGKLPGATKVGREINLTVGAPLFYFVDRLSYLSLSNNHQR